MLSRRGLLTGFAAAIATTSSFAQQAENLPLRRSIGSMAADDPDLLAFRSALAAMKALPATDPSSWSKQADIHLNFCPHKNWYFLPWHRAYLTAFERICRWQSGKKDFALPYWDWTIDTQIPARFSAGSPSDNILNHNRPGLSATESLPSDMVGSEVINRIMQSPDYESFASTRPRGQDSTDARWQRRAGSENELEFNPHDGVHDSLAGDMGQVSLAPRDPIFWLHHCNIDRLWATWNAGGHANSTDVNWLNFVFSNQFFNPDGSDWNVAILDLLSTSTLGYRYELEVGRPVLNASLLRNFAAFRALPASDLAQISSTLEVRSVPGGGSVQIVAVDNRNTANRARPLAIPVPLGRDINDVIRVPPARPSGSMTHFLVGASQRIIANIQGMMPPRDKKTRIRVFLNRDNLSPLIPVSDPHYVTSFSFFEGNDHGHGHSDEGTNVSVDLTTTLAQIARQQRLLGDKIVVQLMPNSASSDLADSEIRPTRVELIII